MANYRVAVVGCGGISNLHAGGYKACERTEIAAGVDVRLEQLEKWGEKHGVSVFYTDLDEMLEKEKPDIVSICTYPESHCELVTKVAPSGVKAILCEFQRALLLLLCSLAPPVVPKRCDA